MKRFNRVYFFFQAFSAVLCSSLCLCYESDLAQNQGERFNRVYFLFQAFSSVLCSSLCPCYESDLAQNQAERFNRVYFFFRHLALSYVLATGGAVGTALSINSLVKVMSVCPFLCLSLSVNVIKF